MLMRTSNMEEIYLLEPLAYATLVVVSMLVIGTFALFVIIGLINLVDILKALKQRKKDGK